MIEDKIFGPLNPRQFISFLLILLISFYVHKNFGIDVSAPFIFLMLGIFIFKIINSPKIIIDEEYLKQKKETTKTEEFDRWIKKAKANIEFQINLRKQKGTIPDPKLEEMYNLLGIFSEENKEV